MIARDPLNALAAVMVLLLAHSAVAAGPRTTADLFPATTLAYAEITNPAEFSAQFASLLKGTTLEDSVALIHKRKDAATTLSDLTDKRELALLGLFTSPEMLAEYKKFHGVAIGLTGFTESGEMEGTLVVLTGESSAAGLAARAYLTMSSSLRKVGEVSRIPVFQHKQPEITYDMNGMPNILNGGKPATETPHGWTFAYTPGLLVAGTSKKAVSSALVRFLGEEKDSLANNSLFQQASAASRRTGLFYFVSYQAFATHFAAANRASGALGESNLYAWCSMVTNPKAILSLAGSISLSDGAFSATLDVTLDAAQKSPLRDFLSGPAVPADLTHHYRGPTTATMTVTLPETNRAIAAIELANGMAKAEGVIGKLPGDLIKEMGKQDTGSNILPILEKTWAVTVVVPTKQEIPKGTFPLPLIVLHVNDHETAKEWEKLLPRLMTALSGSKTQLQGSTESIAGVIVSSLPAQGLPWNGPIHYARAGNLVAIGVDRKLVAAALTHEPGVEKSNLESLTPPSNTGPAVLQGKLAIADLLAAVLERPRRDGVGVPAVMPEFPRFPNNNNAVTENLAKNLSQSRQDFLKALGSIPPVGIAIRKTATGLRFEAHERKLSGGEWNAVIDASILWLDHWGALMSNRRQAGIEID